MKHNWEYKKLGEVCIFKGGYTPKEKDLKKCGKIPYFKVSDMNHPNNSVYLDSTNSYLDVDSKYYEAGAIVFPKNGAAISTNKKRILKYDSVVDLNTGIASPDDSVIGLYLYLFFLHIDFKDYTRRGTIPTLDFAELRNIPIPVPPLSIQTAIVSELDALSAIIADHKSLLKKYDELEQSIFYDMFGDPVKNDKGWECDAFASLFKLKSGDGLTAKDFVEGEYPVYGGNGISGHHNVFNKEGKFIIIGRVGAYCGNVRYVKGKFWLTDNAFELFFDQERFNYTWLPYLLNILDLHQFANHAAQPVISNTGLKGISIILPPLPLQQEFASKIEAIEAMKADTKKSLAKSEELFNARMDYYFNA